MADNQHYVIDDGQNKIPGYSKEETDAAIDAAASNLSNLADAYDATKTYAVGDWCIYDSVLYQCKTAITTAEEWHAAHWQQTTVCNMLKELSAKRAYSYRLRSTTSYQDAASGTALGDATGVGQFLDEKVHAVRSTLNMNAINYISDSVGGARMMAIVMAYGASYYCGYCTTYHTDNKIYGGYGILEFQYMNGTFAINYVSDSRI